MPPASGQRFAFYGRVSTEDHQDPNTSQAWQLLGALAFVSGHGRIVADRLLGTAAPSASKARERANYLRYLAERRRRRPLAPRPVLVPEGVVDPVTGELDE
ncbi:hypothetical protein [Streptomyces sp. NPDC046805]|uniref:hypothetical protein n=1 Tax=Streptomyces sp. NPDC046805 TaxID=3155134 RepID=UPI0034073587